MSELYLIAHKVRGEPAFDVATQMLCPECQGKCRDGEYQFEGCECDGDGFWWIIPTSGHRAYPYWSVELVNIDDQYELNLEYWKDAGNSSECWPSEMPTDLPDHYRPKAEPKRTIDISALIKPKPFTMKRRV